MEDTKLLEMAAKVCGRNLHRRAMPPEWIDRDACMTWNPLVNDGDALRLAVKLGIRISFPAVESHSGYHNAVRAGTFEGGEAEELFEDHEGPDVAARRAIVRAAAQLAPK